MKRRSMGLLGGAVLLVALGAFAVQQVRHTKQVDVVATVPVRKGFFRVTLNAEGTLEVLRSRLITSEIWGATIKNAICHRCFWFPFDGHIP